MTIVVLPAESTVVTVTVSIFIPSIVLKYCIVQPLERSQLTLSITLGKAEHVCNLVVTVEFSRYTAGDVFSFLLHSCENVFVDAVIHSRCIYNLPENRLAKGLLSNLSGCLCRKDRYKQIIVVSVHGVTSLGTYYRLTDHVI